MAVGDRAGKTLHRLTIRHVENFSPYVRSMTGQQAHRLVDAAGVPTRQINNVILVQSPGKALREAEAKITGRTRHY
jgi:hypothetical protein